MISKFKKRAIVLGGGGFIGGHLAKYLKESGFHVRIADIKSHPYFQVEEICHEFIKCDLTDPKAVELVITDNCDELYQLAADIGGAGYIFTCNNDANVMHNYDLINLNVAKECVV
jgi:GDP-D-mannose 3',5'-epimerase